MVKPAITEAEVRRACAAMRIATPFEAMSDMLRAAIVAAARAMAARERERAARKRIDLKRRAAGEFDE